MNGILNRMAEPPIIWNIFSVCYCGIAADRRIFYTNGLLRRQSARGVD